jgi:signal transduction histidine kinase
VTLRSYLVGLTLATLLPVVLFAGAVGYFLVQEQRETFRTGAEARTLAVLTAVDTELQASISTLTALATLPALDEGDLVTFRDRAQRILATQPQWVNVNLARPDGQQVMNLRVPPGAPLPNIGDLDGSFALLRQTGKAVVSDLAVGPVLKRWSFAVRVPVVRDGALKYVLSAGVKADSISAVIKAQGLRPDWVGVIVDRNGRIVARNVDPAGTQGQMASQSLREGLGRAASGWFRGSTLEGSAVYTPFRRSEASGWAFAMGIPASSVDAVVWRGMGFLGLGLFGAIAIAFLLAHLVSRRIATPIGSLVGAAAAMARGAAVEPNETPRIGELRTLAAALHESSHAIAERQELVEREKRALQGADRAKDEFLAMLSHELRNPLAALTAAAHVLKVSDPVGDASAKARGVIQRQTKHMARLIADLLDVGRVSAGKVGLARERMDLSEAVSSVASEWRGSGRFDRHHLSLELASVWVDADRARIEQIAANLFDNAVKFTPAGKGIRVSVRADGDSAVLRVHDEGIGLQAEEGERIFDLFMQGRHAEGGMGIGLALVKRLVELHGGTVAAESEGAGRGAAFTVRLPAVAAPGAEVEPEKSLPGAARSVLLVEDNDDTRHMLEAALAAGGHSVRSARDGAGGLALAAQSPPEVALIDIGLPDMDGYELARRLRSARGCEGLSMVAITGYGRPEDRQRAVEAGFAAHLTKPVTPERLRRALAGLP